MKQFATNQHLPPYTFVSGTQETSLQWKVYKQPTNRPLSNGCINKIYQVFQRINSNGEVIKTTLENVRLTCTEDEHKRILKHLPVLINELFNKEYGIKSTSIDNPTEVMDALIEAVRTKNLSGLILNIGMGASEDTPPLRIASYLIPALKILKGISRANLGYGLPVVHVYKAIHTGVYANGMSMARVKEVGGLTFHFLKSFLKTFSPDYSSCFIFENDNPYFDTPMYHTMIQFGEMLPSLPSIENELARLVNMGRHHGGTGGSRNCHFYASAHPFFNQAIIYKGKPERAITSFNLQNPKPQLIVNLGGHPEKNFNKIVEALRGAVDKNEFECPPLANTIVKVGNTPVYYAAKGGEIFITDECNSIEDFQTDTATKDDYAILFGEVSQQDYLNFAKQFRQALN